MKKILIIEDEKILSDLLQKKLTNEEYAVLTAANGEEGIEQMKKNKPDLVLLDILMPKKSGFEVMEDMAKNTETKDIPVIIISNSGQPVELEKAKKMGAKCCLVKAEFDPQEVIEKIKEQIGK
jgi:CheY-like chemotaxis protein